MRHRLLRSLAGILLCSALSAGPLGAADAPPELFDCVITPSQLIELGSPVPGVLASVEVDRSDQVRQGQVVAKLGSGVEHAAMELAKARAELDTEVQLWRARLRFDEANRRRLESLHSRNVASLQEKDRAERDAVVGAWKVHQARDTHRLRQLELHRAEEVLKRRTVCSPIDGVVVERYRSAGEYVEDQPLMKLARLDPLYIEAIVPMRLFGKLKVGMSAEVFPEYRQGPGLQARVTVVDPMGDAASGTFGVRLELPNPGHAIPAGLKCRVSLTGTAPRFSEGGEAGPEKVVDASAVH